MLGWIWVSAAVPVGIAVATLGLAWLETRLLPDAPPIARTDPVAMPRPPLRPSKARERVLGHALGVEAEELGHSHGLGLQRNQCIIN
jgi:hypothetical protein